MEEPDYLEDGDDVERDAPELDPGTRQLIKQQADELAASLLDCVSGRQKPEELQRLAAASAMLVDTLQPVVSEMLEPTTIEGGDETKRERQVITLLANEAVGIVAAVLRGKSESFSGKTSEFFRRTKRHRLLGRFAIAVAGGATAYAAAKGMMPAGEIASTTLGIGLGARLAPIIPGAVGIGVRAAGGVVRDKVRQKIEAVPPKVIERINTQVAGLSREEAADLRALLLARELTMPLVRDLKALSHDHDLQGGTVAGDGYPLSDEASPPPDRPEGIVDAASAALVRTVMEYIDTVFSINTSS